jgi:hypothetical protein
MGIDCHLLAVDADTARELRSQRGATSLLMLRARRFGCDIHKAWHAIHYVLTGSATGGNEPYCYLLDGGTPLGGPYEGEDAPRLLEPEQVRAFDRVLQPINRLSELRSRFDHAAMAEAGVYAINPGDDEVEEDLDFIKHFFRILRKFIHEAAEAGKAVIVSIG